MIEAKLLYRARCEVCQKPFGPTHSTENVSVFQNSNHYFTVIRTTRYTGPHVCPTCEKKQCAPVNGCLDQSLHDNLIGMGIKKEKGEE